MSLRVHPVTPLNRCHPRCADACSSIWCNNSRPYVPRTRPLLGVYWPSGLHVDSEIRLQSVSGCFFQRIRRQETVSRFPDPWNWARHGRRWSCDEFRRISYPGSPTMQVIASHNRDVEQISALLLQINPDQGIHHHPKASAPQGACPRAQPLTRNHRGAARQKPSTSS